MTSGTAREVLERYRPGMNVASDDTELKSALALAESDPELGRWFAGHCEFQRELVQKTRSVRAPADLKAQLKARLAAQSREALEAGRVTPFPKESTNRGSGRLLQGVGWQALAAAAVLVLLIGSGIGYWKRSADGESEGFDNFRSRMVRSALREYRMDIRSTELADVRGFMSKGGAPADFEVPTGLGQMPLAGGGLLTWRGRPVSMICYGKGQTGMSYLFVMRGEGISGAPDREREVAMVNGRSSVSWTRGGHVYVLMGAEGVKAETLL